MIAPERSEPDGHDPGRRTAPSARGRLPRRGRALRAPLRGTRRSGPRRRSGGRGRRSRTVRGEDRRAGTGRGGPPRGLPHEAAGDGFVEYPRERPLGCHPERDDREVEQERGRSLPGGGWSGSEPREARRDAAGRRLDDILGGGREQVVERGVEPGDDALVRPAPRGQRRGEGPGDDEGRDQQSGLRRPPGQSVSISSRDPRGHEDRVLARRAGVATRTG